MQKIAIPVGAAIRDNPHPGIGFGEFVALVALVMAVNALAIDTMLPALPQIGAALGAASDNHAQLIVTAYLVGFGAAQIFYGPLTDRYGRRPVLIFSLAFYALFGAAAALPSPWTRCWRRASSRASPRQPPASLPFPSSATAIPAGAWRASCR